MNRPATTTATSGRIALLAWAVVLLTVCGVLLTMRASLRIGAWDDAVMFLRYAMHVREGYGISWNPNGPHSAGLTSPLWLAPVVLGTFLPLHGTSSLVVLSTLSGVASALLLACVCRAEMRAGKLSYIATLALVAGSLMLAPPFRNCLVNGMETMFALLMITALVATARFFGKRQTPASALLLAAVSVACVLTRPESGLCALALALCMWLWSGSERKVSALVIFAVSFTLGIALMLVANKMYFGVAVPLPFYIKQRNSYRGFSYLPGTPGYFICFVLSGWLSLVLLLLFARRRYLSTMAAYLVPCAVMVAYLGTVLQITGINGRYYLPYLPLLFVPALAALSHGLAAPSEYRPGWWRVATLIVALGCIISGLPDTCSFLYMRIKQHYTLVYPEATLTTTTQAVLPRLGDGQNVMEFARFAHALPGSPRFALTEAGYGGIAVPDSYVLDMAGLNDAYTALHGQSPSYILGQKPDVIWMPEGSYTWLRGAIFTDPQLLADYDVYPGAFNFGLAVRKDSPEAAAIQAKLAEAWSRLYPGKPEDYRMVSATWDQTLRPE